ncbi:MAG: hypothetical protein GXP45_03915 [bacterium]|nr:hypothetical protein [bacterium]
MKTKKTIIITTTKEKSFVEAIKDFLESIDSHTVVQIIYMDIDDQKIPKDPESTLVIDEDLHEKLKEMLFKNKNSLAMMVFSEEILEKI